MTSNEERKEESNPYMTDEERKAINKKAKFLMFKLRKQIKKGVYRE